MAACVGMFAPGGGMTAAPAPRLNEPHNHRKNKKTGGIPNVINDSVTVHSSTIQLTDMVCCIHLDNIFRSGVKIRD